jgi:hypothetical protein
MLLLQIRPEQGIINSVEQDVDLNEAQNQDISSRHKLFKMSMDHKIK